MKIFAKPPVTYCSSRTTLTLHTVLAKLSKEEIERNAKAWANREPRPRNIKDGHCSREVFRSVATRWLKFLGRLEAPPVAASRYEPLVRSFSDYMLQERGLSPQTARGRCWFLRRFLDRIAGARSLQEITIPEIDNLLQGMIDTKSYARVTVQLWVTNLRAFFRYAETKGCCRKGLAGAIHGPRI